MTLKPEEKEELQAFARRLQEVRHRLRLMQKELAGIIGYSDSFISLLEAAQTKPGYFFFKNMMEKFNVNPLYLLSGEGEMFLEEENKKNIGMVYKGEEKETVAELLYYLENAPVIRFAVLEYFMNYLYQHKDMIDAQIEASRTPRRPKNRKVV